MPERNDSPCRNCGGGIFMSARQTWVHRDSPSASTGTEGCISIHPGLRAEPQSPAVAS